MDKLCIWTLDKALRQLFDARALEPIPRTLLTLTERLERDFAALPEVLPGGELTPASAADPLSAGAENSRP